MKPALSVVIFILGLICICAFATPFTRWYEGRLYTNHSNIFADGELYISRLITYLIILALFSAAVHFIFKKSA